MCGRAASRKQSTFKDNSMTDSGKIFAFDLTRRRPRSFRCRLGGYVILPRMLD